MIDYVFCEYPLPLSSLPEGGREDLKDIKWSEIKFFTSSLDSEGDTYTVSEDGQIYRHEVKKEIVEKENPQHSLDFEVKEKENGILRIDYTGEVNFFSMVLKKDNYDYFLTFKALFWKGVLKEITVDEFEKVDSEKVQKELEEAYKQFPPVIETREERKKRWWYPLLAAFKYVASLIILFAKWLLIYVIRLMIKIKKI